MMRKAKFENISYIRPDYKQYARNIELCAQGIRNADTMETLRRELEEFWGYRTHVETMETWHLFDAIRTALIPSTRRKCRLRSLRAP